MSAKVIAQDIWGWKLIKHSTGNLKYAIWDGNTEVCWCRTEEQARKVIVALRKASFA